MRCSFFLSALTFLMLSFADESAADSSEANLGSSITYVTDSSQMNSDKEIVSLADEYSMDELVERKKRFGKLTTIGIALVPVGIASIVYGGTTAKRDFGEKDTVSSSSIFFIFEGAIGICGGIAMASVMGKKLDQYQRAIKLKSMTVSCGREAVRFSTNFAF